MASQKKGTSFRWVVVTLILLITIISYLDRSAIAYAIRPIQQEFKFTDMQFGLIGSAFAIGYISMTFIGGFLVDKYGTHKIWTIAALVWSLALMLLGQAQSFFAFMAFRILLGMGEAPHFPAITRALSNWLPLSERGRAFSLDLVGVPLASMIGAPLISSLIVAVGWKITFLLLGILGAVWGLAWFILFRSHPQDSKWVNEGELQLIMQHDPAPVNEADIPWKNILFSPSLLSNNLAFFSFGYLVFFAITWLPEYLDRTYQLGIRQTGLWLILPWMTASCCMVAGGFLSDLIWKKTKNLRKARSHLIWISQSLSALAFLMLLFVHNIYGAIICISLGTGLAFFPNGPFLALNADLSKTHAGKTQGVMSTFFALSGVLSPFMTGWLIEATGSFDSAIILMIVLTVLTSGGMVLFQFPDREHLNQKAVIRQ